MSSRLFLILNVVHFTPVKTRLVGITDVVNNYAKYTTSNKIWPLMEKCKWIPSVLYATILFSYNGYVL